MTIRDSAQIKNKNNKNLKNKKSQRLVGDSHAPSSEQQAALDDIANEHRKAVAEAQNAPHSDAQAKAKPNTEDTEAFAEPVTQRVDSQQSVHSSLWVDADDFLSLITQSGSVYDTLPSREGQFNVFAHGMDGAVLAQASGTSLTSDGLLQYKAPPEPEAAPAQGAAAPQAPAQSSSSAPEAAASSGGSGLPALALLGLGGGGGGGGATSTQAVGGTVSDGYIKNASVYVDVNKNGQFDSGTDVLVGTTDNTGRFTGTVDTKYATYNLLVVGGIDTSTGLAFNGVMKAPVGYSVVNPLTTLVSYLTDAGVANPEAKVLSALGLTATMASANASLSSFDPLFYINAGTENAYLAAKVQAVALQVANVIVVGSAAVMGSSTGLSGATKLQAAANAVLEAFADEIKTSDVVQINDRDVLTTILNSDTLKTAAIESGLAPVDALLDNKSQAAGRALEAINSVISSAVATIDADTPAESVVVALANAVKAQWVAQNISGNAATSLMSTLLSGTSSTAYVTDYDSASEITSKSSAAPAPQLNPSGPTVTVTDIAGTLFSGTTYTLTGTLSTALTSGQTLRVSYDGGTNWESVASGNISGTTFSLGNKALGAAGLVIMKVIDSAGLSGLGYTKDFIAPSATVTDDVSGTANLSTGSVVYTYTFNEAVSGLAANDFQVTNGTVASLSGSGTTWTVNVTPAAGVGSGNITLALREGAVTDASGKPNAASSQSNQALDNVAPVISSIAITGATGIQNNTLNAGDVVTVTVTTNGAVSVTGTPRLALNIGGTIVQASYVAGESTGTALKFAYAVQAGQNDASGISIAANSLTMNGGSTITDAAGNALTLTSSALGDNANYLVDTTAPSVSMVTSTVSYGPDSFVAETSADGQYIVIKGSESFALIGDVKSNFQLFSGPISLGSPVSVTVDPDHSNWLKLELSSALTRAIGPLELTYTGGVSDLAGNAVPSCERADVRNSVSYDTDFSIGGYSFVQRDVDGDKNYIQITSNGKGMQALLDQSNGAQMALTDIKDQFDWTKAFWSIDGVVDRALLDQIDKVLIFGSQSDGEGGFLNSEMRIYLTDNFYNSLSISGFLDSAPADAVFDYDNLLIEEGFFLDAELDPLSITNQAPCIVSNYAIELTPLTQLQLDADIYANNVIITVDDVAFDGSQSQATFELSRLKSQDVLVRFGDVTSSDPSSVKFTNLGEMSNLVKEWLIDIYADGHVELDNIGATSSDIVDGGVSNNNNAEVLVYLDTLGSSTMSGTQFIGGHYIFSFDYETSASILFDENYDASRSGNHLLLSPASTPVNNPGLVVDYFSADKDLIDLTALLEPTDANTKLPTETSSSEDRFIVEQLDTEEGPTIKIYFDEDGPDAAISRVLLLTLNRVIDASQTPSFGMSNFQELP